MLLVKHDLWFGHSPQFTNMSVNLMVTWLQNCITYVQSFVGIGVCYLCSFISSLCISSLGTNRMYKLRNDVHGITKLSCLDEYDKAVHFNKHSR